MRVKLRISFLRVLLVVPFLTALLAAQVTVSGNVTNSGSVQVAAIPGGGPLGFADLPVNWVDNTACNPPGGTYDTEVVLGTSNNIGPNVTGEAVGQPYALTPAGLVDAMENWRDNADNGSQTPHFADKWWRIKVPAGTVLHCTSYDANGACVSLPGKGAPSSEPTKCLAVESTTPLLSGQIACSHGLPGFGGTRNPGCTTDKASMWTLQMEGSASGKDGIQASNDLVTPANVANHIVIRDVEITMQGGKSPSGGLGGVPVFHLYHAVQNPLVTLPPTPLVVSNYLGLERSYLHGNDPGDAGQPTTGSSVDAAGNCLAWYHSGTVTVGTGGSVTLNNFTPLAAFSPSNAAFGPTFTVGSSIYLGTSLTMVAGAISGGTPYTISAFDPTVSNNVLTISSPPANGTYQYAEINPPSQYTPGCGDDAEGAVALSADNSWMEYNYIEKIHWQASESHAASYGFDNGPTKIAHNWMEGGSCTLFSGGAPSDGSGGPGSDNEIRGNYLGRDLNYRMLTGGATNSPSPPWGCGTLDSTAGHNTCPFSWAIKNSLETKLGHRNLEDGNIIENSWSDGQSGFAVLMNVEAGSGGQAVGVFDPVTGLPASYVDNIRFSNNWVRNAPQPIQQLSRSVMNPADGGGISLPVKNEDFINNLFTNIGDPGQFGSPGNIWQFAGGSGSSWTCPVTYTGTGPYTITALCKPYQTGLKNPAHVSAITVDASHNVTISHGGIRLDPTLSTSASGTCITSGASWTTCPIIVTGTMCNVSATSCITTGSFAMTGTSNANNNYLADGTYGNTITYNDPASTAGSVCSSVTACTTAIGAGTMTFASLGGKMIDISVGDDVYAYDVGGGDTTCSGNGFASGATAANYAIAGTIPTGLTVVYQLAARPTASSATCLISQTAGFPENVTVQNNTFLSPVNFSIENFAQFAQPLNNYFHDNVFAVTNSASTFTSDIRGLNPAGEGTTAFQSWDPASVQAYHNVLENRDSTKWSVVNCPGGACTNSFPATVNCASSIADATCLGYSGFMGSSPTITYPSGACSDANAPFNCPLMALPWANNVTLSNLNYVGSSSYSAQGVNINQLTNAMTQHKYVCPSGANCGTHGPYPD